MIHQYGNTKVGTESEWINKMTNVNVCSSSKEGKVPTMNIGEQAVKFHIDTESSVNILPV